VAHAARAQTYQEYVRSVLRNPQMVGCHWFKYADEATTGRPLDEENYQIGFVDVADTPYPETVQAARQIGAAMYEARFADK
jgi:agarase